MSTVTRRSQQWGQTVALVALERAQPVGDVGRWPGGGLVVAFPAADLFAHRRHAPEDLEVFADRRPAQLELVGQGAGAAGLVGEQLEGRRTRLAKGWKASTFGMSQST
ncbi:MAG: hypothetical protein QM733_13810 [Ilumatobacteraceae bacterium]